MNKIKSLTAELIEASNLYYNGGTSPLSDKEFDKKLEELKNLENENNFRLFNSPTFNVGSPVIDEISKVSVGSRPMLSLDKCKTFEEIIQFKGDKKIALSTKCDGLSMRLTYEGGNLVSAVTRGNGYEGKDVTEHAKQFLNIPQAIAKKEKYVVDGEAIIFQKDFEKININNEYKNPRNTAAGALGLLDMKDVKKRRLSFIVWDIIEGYDTNSYIDNLCKSEELGFSVVPFTLAFLIHGNEIENIEDIITSLLSITKERGIPCDGVVIRYDDIEYGESLGRTDKFFRNAIAYKPKDEEAETSLIYINWTMGRTGTLCPVAVFSPVELEGTIVTRASLHNLGIMEELLGEEPFEDEPLTIIKANKIIPQVIRADKEFKHREGELYHKFSIPAHCPICSESTKIVQTDIATLLTCPNPTCSGKLLNQITHFCGKKGLDIKYINEKTINFLMDKGWLDSLSDLYSLAQYKVEWIKCSGWGEKSVNRILDSIEQSKNCKLENFLAAIGIPQIGLSITKDIVKVYPTYDDFRKAVTGKKGFFTINGISDIKSSYIIRFNYQQADIIARMMTFTEPVVGEIKEGAMTNKKFAITGDAAPFNNRAELIKYIESKGGKVVSTVSKNTNYLISNDKNTGTAKIKKAVSLNIPVLSIEELMEIF